MEEAHNSSYSSFNNVLVLLGEVAALTAPETEVCCSLGEQWATVLQTNLRPFYWKDYVVV